MVVDTPEMTRYMCGFRTALEPGAIVARARGVPNVEWTVVEPVTLSLQLLGNQTDCLHLEIWSESSRQPGERLYGLSVATPTWEEGAKTFFEWRAKIFEAFDAKLVVTSVKEEIRATLDARRDTLELDGQDLTELTGDIRLLHEHLEVLSLSNNRLTKLPVEIGCLKKLTELDVSDNLLAELPEQIGTLVSLKQLSVAHNRLRELPASIGRLFNLKELWVNDNKLRKLPHEIGQLTKLRWLRIQKNRLTELPKEFAQLSLQEWKPTVTRALVSPRWGLMAQENPWVHPPEETIRGGPKPIRDFLTAHPRRVAADGEKNVYVVYADDNKHCYEEEWKRRKVGAFADCGAATEACLRLVDGYLATQGTRNAKDLMEAYRTSGEDPWICSDDPGCLFDAWSYAEQRCSDIEAGKPVATNTKTCNLAPPPGTAEQPRQSIQKFVFSLDLEEVSEFAVLRKFGAAVPDLKWRDVSEGTWGKIRVEGERTEKPSEILWVGLTCREPPGPSILTIILEATATASSKADTLKARLVQALAAPMPPRMERQP